MGSGDVRGRRRGEALETALLAAAWDHLRAVGPSRFSLEGVAERAGTSKPVLYRRWANAAELMTATLAWAGRQNALPVPETGNFRDDLLAVLREANARPERSLLLLQAAACLIGEEGPTPGDLRNHFQSAAPPVTDLIFDRAVVRGEIEKARLTSRLRSLPFDLFRARLMMTLAPLSEAELLEIIDEVVIPLATRHTRETEVD